jgi:hypothetical protein
LIDTVALLVSLAALGVSIFSLVTARQAKQQAKQSGALSHRTEAIRHLHDAVSDMQSSRSVNPKALKSICDAKHLADVVFNSNVTKSLGDAVRRADGLLKQRVKERKDQDQTAVNALLHDLQNLIERMNDDAALR